MAETTDLFSENQNENNYVKGNVAAIFFQNADTFYKVLLVKIEKTDLDWQKDEIVVTGNFGDIDEDNSYTFYGKIVTHPRYGDQFKSDNYESNLPTSKDGLVSYLSGENFQGVGKKTAEKVVDYLGMGAIDEILNNPDSLREIGLSEKQYDSIIHGVNENNGVEQIIVALNSYGFGSQLASTIFKKYQGDTLKIIKNNPYQLVEDINGISFKKADHMARHMGFSLNSAGRLRAGLMTALKKLSIKDGNTYTTTKPLLNETLSLLNNSSNDQIDSKKLADEMVELARDHKIVGEDQRIYLTRLYEAEWQIAKNVYRIQSNDKESFKTEDIQKNIQKIEKDLNIDYDQSQVSALKEAMNSSLFLLTGGPGTGKTTIIQGIVQLYASLEDVSLDFKEYSSDEPYPVLLAAPTGRAAKKMNESTGMPASTIHRLLGLTTYDDYQSINEATQELEGGLLIIDEMSMVDTYLFRLLLQSIPNGMKVILVGDKDQLPSVGPGQIFNDLLESQQISKMELTMIHRQESNSTIIPLAHDIKNGKLPDNFKVNQSDRSFIPCQPAQISNAIDQVTKKAKSKGFNSSDIQVLAPMYRGEAGINHLNEVIQEIMNPKTSPDQKELEYRGIKYRIGDKVLQLVNNSEEDVFNGDIGNIVGIDIGANGKTSQDKITIAFDQIEVEYRRKDWDQITLAYCTSIHKAQGSEFKVVILPMVPQYSFMLQRNLLYTAITRSSDMLILIGDYDSFIRCLNNRSIVRNTTLVSRLRKVINKEDYIDETPKEEKKEPTDNNSYESTNENANKEYLLTDDLIKSDSIDPMIGMNELTPSYFMK